VGRPSREPVSQQCSRESCQADKEQSLHLP
jgi:hypothetical protein